ncbi:Atrial natriuretic peptide receptor 2 [Hypsibius exemplaris]|uniref:Atrial natriuretic peptide receptor 2 n=1 Tax=Hypsibius exemplaris TaxID=2072580 RepID=A0A1W0WX19_HYPEX|nr:Atrial natriuretic peptide receptor 2 [Hypsibius exemplaris]
MVDEALQNLTTWPIDDTDRNDDLMQSKENMKSRLVINRLTMNETATTPMRQLQFYTRINLHLLKWIGKAILHSQSHEQRWQHLTAYHTFITAKEHFGSERGSATVYFARGKMELDIYLFHLRKRFEGIAFLNKSRQYNSYIDQQLDLHYNGTQLEANITVQRSLLEGNNQSHKDVQAGWIYFQQMTSYLDILHDIEKALADNLIEDLNKSLYFTGMTFWADLFVLILAVVLLPAIIIFLRTITGQIQNFAKILQAKNEEIVKEKRRADAVLCQLLPRQIAEKMKNREVVHPESYDQVTVFFSDIVDFTSFSAVSTPMQVVETLNKLYTAIDSRVENYDVYKVETIGDAYLCVSGLPERNGNRHSYEIASMSLELLTDVVRIVIPHKQDYTMRLRIGMHTGPCAAGIVGQRMPRYCIASEDPHFDGSPRRFIGLRRGLRDGNAAGRSR